ncbi:hypothetical protein Ciccas_003984 [Cichlidogyrus casuarinus]|uniref:Uncharacterized protein n=1 Tax=Cichlidogyrus casuarinus TaxID=1844966 RepID=A0ABD2QCU8_9PLAT
MALEQGLTEPIVILAGWLILPNIFLINYFSANANSLSRPELDMALELFKLLQKQHQQNPSGTGSKWPVMPLGADKIQAKAKEGQSKSAGGVPRSLLAHSFRINSLLAPSKEPKNEHPNPLFCAALEHVKRSKLGEGDSQKYVASSMESCNGGETPPANFLLGLHGKKRAFSQSNLASDASDLNPWVHTYIPPQQLSHFSGPDSLLIHARSILQKLSLGEQSRHQNLVPNQSFCNLQSGEFGKQI